MKLETELNIALTEFFRPIVAQCVQEAIQKMNVVPSVVNADQLMTIDEAAEFLHLTTQTIYGLVSDRKIPFSKPTGSRLYFSRLELMDWLKSHRTGTVDEQAQQYDQDRGKRRTRKNRYQSETSTRP